MSDRDDRHQDSLEFEQREAWQPPMLVSLEALANTLGQASGPDATDGGTFPIDYNS